MLDSLKEVGVQLAIDNFGTGYSCLAHLQKSPVDLIKIDPRFVTKITNNNVQNQVASATIKLGHSLEFKVLAAGVETDL